MAKYFRFTYDAGYVGTREEQIYKFSDSTTETEVKQIFEDWYEDIRTDSGNFEEISEKEAEIIGIDDDLSGDN